MKHFSIYTIALALLMGLLVSCSKSSNNPTKTNINLSDTTLSVTQAYTTGKWKIIYATGGFINQQITFPNSYLTISKDSLLNTNNDTIAYHLPITWVRGSFYADSAFVITNSNYGIDYIALSITNDTLMLSDNHTEALSYRLIKAN